MTQPVPLVITGAAGRMGQMLVQTARQTSGVELAAAVEAAGHPSLGQDAGRIAGLEDIGIPLQENLAGLLQPGQVVVDFTLASATPGHIAACCSAGTGLVLGTTGHSEQERQLIEDASRRIPIVFAPNMSAGVNLCFQLLAQAAKALGREADIEIMEMHHRSKQDAPSGTALGMGEVIADALGTSLASSGVFSRVGQTGPRPPGSIGFQSLRGGDVAGEHTVIFATEGERLEISHKAYSRAGFAKGALAAASWLAAREPGLYDMQDVLGLRE